MSKKNTIGANPLSAYLGSTKKTEKKSTKQKKQAPVETKKQRVTIHLSVDLIERVKNVVFWEPGLTLTDFTQEALKKLLDKYEKKRGEQYPERKHQLKGGRPLG